MNQSQLNSLIRDGLKWIGLYLMAKGYASAGTFVGGEQAAGLLSTGLGLLWSYFHHSDGDTTPPRPGAGGLSALLLTLTAAGLLAGCANPQTAAYKTDGVVIHTVDSAMHAWADYANAGKASPEKIAAVKKTYGYYYDAQMLLKAALEKWIATGSPADKAATDTANQAVADAGNALIDLITKLRTPHS